MALQIFGSSTAVLANTLVTRAERKARHDPYRPKLPARVTADQPTITYTTTVPAGTAVLYTDPRFTFHGYLPGTDTVNGTACTGNAANATGTTPAFEVEFDSYDTVVAIRHMSKNGAAGFYKYQVYVDGEPVSTAPISVPAVAAASAGNILLTFGAARLRRIRVAWQSDFPFRSVYVSANGSLTPVTKDAKRVYLLGDSWVEGTGATDQQSTLAYTLQMLSGWEVFRGGQGGTGYITDGSWKRYGDASRIAAIVATAPDLVVVQGSINDGASPSTVGTAASALYAALATQVPAAKVVVVGVQGNGSATPATWTNNNAAIKTAALAAPNVLAFIDPITDGWITGTGTTGAPGGNGNAGSFMGGTTGVDGNHPSPAGHAYWGQRLWSALNAINGVHL